MMLHGGFFIFLLSRIFFLANQVITVFFFLFEF